MVFPLTASHTPPALRLQKNILFVGAGAVLNKPLARGNDGHVLCATHAQNDILQQLSALVSALPKPGMPYHPEAASALASVLGTGPASNPILGRASKRQKVAGQAGTGGSGAKGGKGGGGAANKALALRFTLGAAMWLGVYTILL